jgi:hypothetical protein
VADGRIELAASFPSLGFQSLANLSVRPRASGTQFVGRNSEAYSANIAVPDGGGLRLRLIRPTASPASLEPKNIVPCLHASGQRIAHIPSSSPPLASRGGMARRQSAVPGLLQANVRQRPDHGAQRCTRALRRANGHLRLTPRQRSDQPGAICPWGFSPSVARGPVCVIADPQVPSRSPPCKRLRKAPHEL